MPRSRAAPAAQAAAKREGKTAKRKAAAQAGGGLFSLGSGSKPPGEEQQQQQLLQQQPAAGGPALGDAAAVAAGAGYGAAAPEAKPSLMATLTRLVSGRGGSKGGAAPQQPQAAGSSGGEDVSAEVRPSGALEIQVKPGAAGGGVCVAAGSAVCATGGRDAGWAAAASAAHGGMVTFSRPDPAKSAAAVLTVAPPRLGGVHEVRLGAALEAAVRRSAVLALAPPGLRLEDLPEQPGMARATGPGVVWLSASGGIKVLEGEKDAQAGVDVHPDALLCAPMSALPLERGDGEAAHGMWSVAPGAAVGGAVPLVVQTHHAAARHAAAPPAPAAPQEGGGRARGRAAPRAKAAKAKAAKKATGGRR